MAHPKMASKEKKATSIKSTLQEKAIPAMIVCGSEIPLEATILQPSQAKAGHGKRRVKKENNVRMLFMGYVWEGIDERGFLHRLKFFARLLDH